MEEKCQNLEHELKSMKTLNEGLLKAEKNLKIVKKEQ